MILGTSRRAAALVLALSLWSAGEAYWQLTVPSGQGVSIIVVVWAFALPLPLVAARSAPGLASLGVVALVVARDVAEQRAPGAAAQTVVLIVALFLSEAGSPPRSFPWRGLAAGGLLLGGILTMDLLGFGVYQHASIGGYSHALTLAIGGVSAGIALRDRGAEAEQREREVRELEATSERRLDVALADERARIAGEVDGAVALLLGGVRPLADRARCAGAGELAELMGTVHDRAQAAMLELRRAVRLLRAPDSELELAPPTGVREVETSELGSAVAAARRTRAEHVLGVAAPVVLLALLGIADQLMVLQDPFPTMYPVPDPVLGSWSPWVTAVLCPLPLLWRSRWPVPATLAVFAFVVVRMLLHDLSTLTFTQFYVVAATTFIGATQARNVLSGAAVVFAGTAACVLCMVLEQQPYEAYAYSFIVLLPVACGVGGLLVRDRAVSAARAHRAHERADRVHETRAREHLLAERLSAARELHDVVGHAVTIITLQAAVAVRYAPLDLVRARHAGAAVAQVAGDVERDLARLGASAAAADDLAGLVARSGLPVALDQRVETSALPLPLALTMVRIVQEALTNVGRHAGPVPVTVTVSLVDRRLVIEVVNAAGRRGVGGGSGRGLAGMLERVELYGGHLVAGPGADGGWRVRAELPVPGPDRLTASAAP
ncbi:histidine kinase [Solirubrobacter phytolaccae]|uniref:histidine kinase n=1 Tax=Solirubrobacter phytolaccae TaxID=1404360 RepID=A0A9X3SFZ8_9ACTN|nr:histidine kinase [Solirubrobacter phytolaccae]MDA0181952.1 histidine kinase [Solirubrobacter phytolaccae]